LQFFYYLGFGDGFEESPLVMAEALNTLSQYFGLHAELAI